MKHSACRRHNLYKILSSEPSYFKSKRHKVAFFISDALMKFVFGFDGFYFYIGPVASHPIKAFVWDTGFWSTAAIEN